MVNLWFLGGRGRKMKEEIEDGLTGCYGCDALSQITGRHHLPCFLDEL